MSTCYRFRKPVPFAKVKKLKIKGIEVQPSENGDPNHVILCDGTNYLHAYTGDGTDTGMTRYGLNDPTAILAELTERFGRIFSEHDDEYYEGMEELPDDLEPGMYVSNKADARGHVTIHLRMPEEKKKRKKPGGPDRKRKSGRA